MRIVHLNGTGSRSVLFIAFPLVKLQENRFSARDLKRPPDPGADAPPEMV
jgi:hypothetical protein